MRVRPIPYASLALLKVKYPWYIALVFFLYILFISYFSYFLSCLARNHFFSHTVVIATGCYCTYLGPILTKWVYYKHTSKRLVVSGGLQWSPEPPVLWVLAGQFSQKINTKKSYEPV
eukprot:Rmarinus@m.17274